MKQNEQDDKELGDGGSSQIIPTDSDLPEAIEVEGVLERVRKLDPEVALQVEQLISYQHEVHYGPMPSSKDLARYKEIQTDLPERMMKMAEFSLHQKGAHNTEILRLKAVDQENENKAHSRQIFTQNLGMIFAFLFACIGVGCAVYLAMADKTAVASIIAGGTLIAIVTKFISPSSRDQKPSQNDDSLRED